MKLLIPLAIAALTFLLVLLQPTKADYSTACSPADAEIVRLLNVKRAEATQADGIRRPPLQTSEALCRAADIRATELRTKFSHTRPNGTSFGTVLTQVGVAYRKAAEFTYYIAWSPKATVDVWWRYEFRRTETLRPAYRYAGAACCGYAVALLVKP